MQGAVIFIRTATQADIPAITQIYGHAVLHGTASYELEPPSPAEMAARQETLLSGSFPYLVAHDESGKILGYAYAAPFRPRRAYRFTVEDSVYVAPEAQGHGVGKLLLQALILECEKLGFRQIMAVIGDGTHHPASVSLHKALGFHLAGTIIGSGFKHGRWLDTVLMQLTINDGTDRPPDPDSMPERHFRNRT